VVLENRMVYPDLCLTAIGPAWFRTTFYLDEGVFDFSISLEDESDHYQLIVDQTSARFSGPDGSFSRIDRAAVPRE